MALFKDFEQIIDEQEKKTNKLFIDENNSHESIKSTLEIEINNNNTENELYNSYINNKYCGIQFFKIGNTYAFGINKNNNPIFVIGPHWYLFVLMNGIIIMLSTFIHKTIMQKYSNNLTFIGYIFIVCIIIAFYYTTFLINPGLILKKQRDELNQNYCSNCRIYYNSNSKVSHCRFCNVCIEGFDHHCVWVGKCIGKNNLKTFYGLLFSVLFFYVYIIVAFSIIYFSKEKELTKKN